VKPCARTTAAAACTPSAPAWGCAKAGSGAERVFVGAEVPPLPCGGAGAVGAVRLLDVLRAAVLAGGCSGASPADTVFVFEPQAASSGEAEAAARSTTAVRTLGLTGRMVLTASGISAGRNNSGGREAAP